MAVFEVQEALPWNVGRLAVVGASIDGPAFQLLDPISEAAFTPADILRGNLPEGVTLLWTQPGKGREPE